MDNNIGSLVQRRSTTGNIVAALPPSNNIGDKVATMGISPFVSDCSAIVQIVAGVVGIYNTVRQTNAAKLEKHEIAVRRIKSRNSEIKDIPIEMIKNEYTLMEEEKNCCQRNCVIM